MMHSWQSPGTSVMPLSLLHFQLFNSLSAVLPSKIKSWTFCMQMLKMLSSSFPVFQTRSESRSAPPITKLIVMQQPVAKRAARRHSRKDFKIRLETWGPGWDARQKPHEVDSDAAVKIMTDRINYWLKDISPALILKGSPHNKPWINRDLKEQLNKERAFGGGHSWIIEGIALELQMELK